MSRNSNLTILSFLFLFGLSGCLTPKTTPRPAIPVRVAKLGGAGAESGTRFSATVKPDAQVDLAFKAGGYVEEVAQVKAVDGTKRNIQEGDPVQKGTMLARVRETEFRDQVAEAEAGLTKAKADFQRAAQLYETGGASKADYDAAFAALTSTKARHQQASTVLRDTKLVSPMDGLVVKRAVEVGTLATPGMTAFSVANTKSVKILFGVPDTMVGKMKLGSPQTVITSAVPDEEFKGVISRVAASADLASRDFDIEISIPNPKGVLKAGMIASLKIDIGQPVEARGTRVPVQAVVRPKGDAKGYAVFVVEENGGKAFARERKIVPGDLNGNDVTVSSGVKDGDQIIITGNTLVQDGQEVRVVP